MRMIFALLLAIASPAAASPPAANPLAALVAGTDPRAPQLAGVVGVVATRDSIVRAEAHGLADIAAGRPLETGSVVRVASISKLVVAVAVWRLVEQGKLDLDSDVSRYLGWQLRHPAHPETPVTLRQLLSHRSI